MEMDFRRCDYTLEYMMEYLHDFVEKTYKKDKEKIEQALILANSAHEKQRRSDNIPFVIHPIRVALMLVHYDRNIIGKVFIAALLHDVLEDTNLTISVIEDQFGKYVARLVQSVTRPHKNVEDIQEKQKDKRQHWEEIICEDHEVRAIKTFEELDNMLYWKTIPEESPVKQKLPRWFEEAQGMSLPLAHTTNLHAYKMMLEECENYGKKADAIEPVTR